MKCVGFQETFALILWIVFLSESFTYSSNVCPELFIALGKKCYYFSKNETSWHDAHFSCRSLNSSLAVITKPHQELMLRRYLNRNLKGRYERWIGGRYNEKQEKWVWGENGRQLEFQGFSRMNPRDSKWAWHCITTDPNRKNKWGAQSCFTNLRYICQRPVLNNSGKKCKNKACSEENLGAIKPGFLQQNPHKKYRLKAFVCPSHMILVGRKCYFFSTEKASWGNAYWACRDNKTKLAMISNKMQDNILRGFLDASFTTEKHERWIGGIYDWQQQQWKWAINGNVIKYQNFANHIQVDSSSNAHHCITLDPHFNNLWNSKNRLEEKHYICQVKSKTVMKYEKE